MQSVGDFARFKAEGRRISVITAYDAWSASIVAQSQVDAMLVGNSVVGLYYYIKVVAVMFQQPEAEAEPRPRLRPSIYLASVGTLAVLTLLLVLVGVYPAALVEVIQQVFASAPVMAGK